MRTPPEAGFDLAHTDTVKVHELTSAKCACHEKRSAGSQTEKEERSAPGGNLAPRADPPEKEEGEEGGRGECDLLVALEKSTRVIPDPDGGLCKESARHRKGQTCAPGDLVPPGGARDDRLPAENGNELEEHRNEEQRDRKMNDQRMEIRHDRVFSTTKSGTSRGAGEKKGSP